MNHLHCHNQFSLLDGLFSSEQWAKFAAEELKSTALAITNHGNLSGILEHIKACNQYRIKPIIGCEVYVVPDRMIKKERGQERHLVLWARNEEGFKNLVSIVNDSFLNGFYYRPRTDLSVLRKCCRGIIAGTACVKGILHDAVFSDDSNRNHQAEKIINQYAIFDNLFLEIQPHDFPEQIRTNWNMLEWSKRFKFPLLTTNDCHYIRQQDNKVHEALLLIQTHKTFKDIEAGKSVLRFTGDDFYMKSKGQILDDYTNSMGGVFNGPTKQQIHQSIRNAMDFPDVFEKNILPNVDLTPSFGIKNPGREIISICNQGWKQFILPKLGKVEADGYHYSKEKYATRLQMEMELIKEPITANVFLIIHDLVKFAKSKGILIRARGSACGSLATFLMGISDIDPIRYKLLFERFLNPARTGKNLPDIDLDIEHDRRGELKDYLAKRWGEKSIINIATFERFKARNVLKDVSRVYGIPFDDVNIITREMAYSATLKEARSEFPSVDQFARKYPNVFEIALALEGQVRHLGKHAAGFGISNKNIYEYCPVMMCKKEILTQWDDNAITEYGILKFDLLGSKSLSVIDRVLKDVGKDIKKISISDSRVYKEFALGRTIGVFQFNKRYFQELTRKAKPKNLLDLSILVALGRPGAKDSFQDQIYLGNNIIRINDPILQEITRSTRGAIVFQEQVMELCQKIGGLNLHETNILRKAIGKKDKFEMAKYKKLFVAGAKKQEYNNKHIDDIWALVETHSNYSFNKSHAVSYSFMSYITMYLKIYYPNEFFCHMLNIYSDDKDKFEELVLEATRCGMRLEPPHILYSDSGFRVKTNIEGGKKLLQGFISIRGVGEKTYEKIKALRDKYGDKVSEYLTPAIKRKLLAGGVIML